LKADGRETVIGNFAPTPENRDRMSGPGMATITLMARTYKDAAQWVWVAKKGDPDLVEIRLKVTNESLGEIPVASVGIERTIWACVYELHLGVAEDPRSSRTRLSGD
jgi:IS4 transposase